MSLKQRFFLAIRIQHGPKRWVYLPYILLMAGTFLFGLGSEIDPSGLWPYLVLLSVFTIQLIWPTMMGWAAAVGGLFIFFFLFPVFSGVPLGFFGFLWAVGLLVPLYLFRPTQAICAEWTREHQADPRTTPRPGGNE